jgi:hypothetical protein
VKIAPDGRQCNTDHGDVKSVEEEGAAGDDEEDPDRRRPTSVALKGQ